MKERYHLTAQSRNIKTGPLAVTTTGDFSCPPSCPFGQEGTCYAMGGKLRIHWGHVSSGDRGLTWAKFLAAYQLRLSLLPERALSRYNQAGDLPGRGDRIDAKKLYQLALASSRSGARVFTYTHKPVLAADAVAAPKNKRADIARKNRSALRASRKKDGAITINLSANNLAHADRLLRLKLGPVAAAVPQDTPERTKTPAGHPAVVCPAQIKDEVTCATCGLCAVDHPNRPVVMFRPEGASKKKQDRLTQCR